MASRKVTMVVLFALLLSTIAMAQVKEIPTRDQIQDKYKWNLADFYPSDSAWAQGLEAIKARLPEIASLSIEAG